MISCYRATDNVASSKYLYNVVDDLNRQFPNASDFLFGDFHFPGVTWDFLTVATPNSNNEPEQFLDICLSLNLTQVLKEPIRLKHLLDLLLTNSPDHVKSVLYLPGLSDYKIINLTIFLILDTRSWVKKKFEDYKRPAFESINIELYAFLPTFHVQYLSRSINENSSLVKNNLNDLINPFISSVIIKRDKNHSWFNKTLKRLSNKTKHLFRIAKKRNTQVSWDKYEGSAKTYAKEVQTS